MHVRLLASCAFLSAVTFAATADPVPQAGDPYYQSAEAQLRSRDAGERQEQHGSGEHAAEKLSGTLRLAAAFILLGILFVGIGRPLAGVIDHARFLTC